MTKVPFMVQIETPSQSESDPDLPSLASQRAYPFRQPPNRSLAVIELS